MAHSLLSQIHDGSNQWTVCALVSRLWHYRGGTDVGPIAHTDLVLLDTEGNHMYAQLPPATSDRLKDVLQEGKVYVIRKFLCNPSRPSFRAVESPFMIQFTRYTTLEERPGLEVNYPFCTYSLTAFADIPDPSGPPAHFIDVIGKISQVSDVTTLQSMYQTVPSKTRTIILTDLTGAEMRLVLWGDRAVEFDADTVRAMGEKEPVIGIFVGTLPKTARGAKILSDSSACRWYIDEDIPDINSFRASLGDQFTPIAAYTPTGPNAPIARVYEDPVELSMELLNKVDPFVDMEKRFLCSVTVNRLAPDNRWWFASCSSCRKSAKYDGYQYQCSGLNCSCVKATLTYCLSVFASDDTGEAEFVLFDKVAAVAVGKQVMTLLRQRYPGRSSAEDIAQIARHDTTIPLEINALIGQKFKLLVCISKKCQTSNSEDLSFQVCKIEETYKPELPPLAFPAALGSISASSSASSFGTKLPPLGSPRSAMQHTPSPLGHAGYGSPMCQAPASTAANLGPATPAKGSTAPKRGAKRSLFTSPSKVQEKAGTKNALPAEEAAEIVQPFVEAVADDIEIAVENKDDGVQLPKTKRTSTNSKGGGSTKKPKAQ